MENSKSSTQVPDPQTSYRAELQGARLFAEVTDDGDTLTLDNKSVVDDGPVRPHRDASWTWTTAPRWLTRCNRNKRSCDGFRVTGRSLQPLAQRRKKTSVETAKWIYPSQDFHAATPRGEGPSTFPLHHHCRCRSTNAGKKVGGHFRKVRQVDWMPLDRVASTEGHKAHAVAPVAMGQR